MSPSSTSFGGGLLVSPPRVLQRAITMSLDDVLFGVIIAGIGLCVAHFRGEYIRWRQHRAAERRQEMSMRELHIRKLLR